VQNEISFAIETEQAAENRRYRWQLKARDEDAVKSPQSFATKREAEQAGQIALERARERGRIAR
jgi:hypothetical protein